MIIASGYKVWPREVEDVLAEHPAVREAAVVGIADEYRGETVKAFVSLVAGASVTPEDLIDHCKQRMAAYKYPRSVVLVEELPKTVHRQDTATGTAHDLLIAGAAGGTSRSACCRIAHSFRSTAPLG